MWGIELFVFMLRNVLEHGPYQSYACCVPKPATDRTLFPALDFTLAVDLAAGCVSINPQLSMPVNLATSNHEQSLAVVATYTITIQPPNHGSDYNTLA